MWGAVLAIWGLVGAVWWMTSGDPHRDLKCFMLPPKSAAQQRMDAVASHGAARDRPLPTTIDQDQLATMYGWVLAQHWCESPFFLDPDRIIKGLRAGMAGEEASMTEEEWRQQMRGLVKHLIDRGALSIEWDGFVI